MRAVRTRYPGRRKESIVDEVVFDLRDGVAHIILSAPTRRNALTPAMADQLVDSFARANADPSVGAVVVSGEGGAFCAGADLSSLGDVMDDPVRDDAFEAINRIYRAFLEMGRLHMPSIACLRGASVGAGVNLAFAADVRIAADDARIISGFTRMGLHPGGGHLALLAQASSRETAAAMAIFGQEVSGAEAARRGLVWESVPDEEVEERALRLASTIAADPALARHAAASLKLTTGLQGDVWHTAVNTERVPQLWSLRRKADPTT